MRSDASGAGPAERPGPGDMQAAPGRVPCPPVLCAVPGGFRARGDFQPFRTSCIAAPPCGLRPGRFVGGSCDLAVQRAFTHVGGVLTIVGFGFHIHDFRPRHSTRKKHTHTHVTSTLSGSRYNCHHFPSSFRTIFPKSNEVMLARASHAQLVQYMTIPCMTLLMQPSAQVCTTWRGMQT